MPLPAPAPGPAYPPEASLRDLAAAELLLLTMWRLHGAALAGCGQATRWQGGLAAAGLGPETARECRSLFDLLAAGAPGLTRRQPRCPQLGEDEARLLQLISLLQRGEEAAAGALLAGWLPPSLARLVRPPAAALARALAARQLTVPARRPAPAWPVRPASSDRGLALVH